MIITSSRKPSAKTRTLCKLLSRFVSGRCINRGKMGMQELLESVQGGPLIVIGEYHGNPGELSFFNESSLLFSIRFTDWYSQELDSFWFQETEPALTGKGEVADALESFFHFQQVESDEIDKLPSPATLIAAGEQEIEFIGDGKSLFKFNIKGFKKY